ncbi:putative protein with domain of unknown function (DUF4604), partial [Lyophyllum shimeji]
RPDDDPGSANEDDEDEKPQVVVLKEGKHLTAHEAENVRRKEKGLPPLPDPAEAASKNEASKGEAASPAPGSNREPAAGSKTQPTSLSFSSSKTGVKTSNKKRRALGDPEDATAGRAVDPPSKKKSKKQSKTLLSFGDDA